MAKEEFSTTNGKKAELLSYGEGAAYAGSLTVKSADKTKNLGSVTFTAEGVTLHLPNLQPIKIGRPTGIAGTADLPILVEKEYGRAAAEAAAELLSNYKGNLPELQDSMWRQLAHYAKSLVASAPAPSEPAPPRRSPKLDDTIPKGVDPEAIFVG